MTEELNETVSAPTETAAPTAPAETAVVTHYCKSCKMAKPLDSTNFIPHPNPSVKLGFYSQCRSCKNGARRKQWSTPAARKERAMQRTDEMLAGMTDEEKQLAVEDVMYRNAQHVILNSTNFVIQREAIRTVERIDEKRRLRFEKRELEIEKGETPAETITRLTACLEAEPNEFLESRLSAAEVRQQKLDHSQQHPSQWQIKEQMEAAKQAAVRAARIAEGKPAEPTEAELKAAEDARREDELKKIFDQQEKLRVHSEHERREPVHRDTISQQISQRNVRTMFADAGRAQRFAELEAMRTAVPGSEQRKQYDKLTTDAKKLPEPAMPVVYLIHDPKFNRNRWTNEEGQTVEPGVHIFRGTGQHAKNWYYRGEPTVLANGQVVEIPQQVEFQQGEQVPFDDSPRHPKNGGRLYMGKFRDAEEWQDFVHGPGVPLLLPRITPSLRSDSIAVKKDEAAHLFRRPNAQNIVEQFRDQHPDRVIDLTVEDIHREQWRQSLPDTSPAKWEI